jgi:hypothetical protein
MSGAGVHRPGAQIWHRVAVVVGVAIVGALAGFVLGLFTRTHLELAGSQVSIRLIPGQTYDQVDLSGALTGKRAASRSVFGEPIGVRADFDVDAGFLVGPDGTVNSDVLPAYLQAFSDPDQVISDVRSAFVRHLVWFTSFGAAAGALAAIGWYAYRTWRAGYDRRLGPDARRTARAYRAPERTILRRVVIVLMTAAVLNAIPGAVRTTDPATTITPDPVLTDTPLAGTELDGLLRPAIVAAESYVRKYFADTDTYYNELRDKLDTYLATEAPVTLPSGDGVVQFGFVTDRHCNNGMDRVIVALLGHYGISTLVSGGDDDFSGSFPFESACTGNLADQTRRAGITDVFAAGNHDSAQTLADERKQGIKVLDDKIVSVGDLHFLGDPDPRTSRYGQGIVPASTADQRRLLDEQSARIAAVACAQDQKVIVVLHDPRAGVGALDAGCGNAVLALDGHTHQQAGPDRHLLFDGSLGSQFVGGSTGGAPNENSVERSFSSALTVGPLNHDASVNLVSYDTSTGQLVAVTVFHFTPDQQISVEQLAG